jgi:outer membrane protein OmpA-like peptidoglycan-associated protein
MKLKSPILLAAVAALALSACTSPDTATTNPNQRTQEGALIGGLIGAVAGAATGDDGGERRRGALIGGLVGAGVGAAIGNNLDRQAAELQQSMDSRVQIINNGNELIVRMPQDILFPVDSAAVNPGLQDDLRALAASLQRYPNSTVQVVGHTDNTGAASYNQNLSERRANAVSAVLISAGVSSARIRAFGLGESDPLTSNLTEEGRAQNRRVDIRIIPNG